MAVSVRRSGFAASIRERGRWGLVRLGGSVGWPQSMGRLGEEGGEGLGSLQRAAWGRSMANSIFKVQTCKSREAWKSRLRGVGLIK